MAHQAYHQTGAGTIIESLEGRRLLSAGDLVTSYGSGGVATLTYVGRTDDIASAIASLPDGRILVGGNSVSSGSERAGTLRRFKPDGSPDPTFGTDGSGGIRLASPGYAGIVDLAVFPDDSFIGIGEVSTGAPAGAPRVQKFTPTGTAEPAWVGAGTLPGGTPRAIEPLAAGRSIYATSTALARLNADGTLDSSFGTGGFTSFPVEAQRRFSPRALAVQPDGAIVLAGAMEQTVLSRYTPAARRYTADGQLDTTFGNGGTVELTSAQQASTFSALRDVRILQGGRILVGGGNGARPVVAALDAAGALDATYGQRPLGAANGSVATLIVQPDGRILAAGTTGTGTGNLAFLALMDATGASDTTYGGGDGIVESVMPSSWQLSSYPHVIVQPKGDLIMAGGGRADPNSGLEQFVTRIRADGTIDPQFKPDPSPQLAGIRRHHFTAPLPASLGASTVMPDGGVLLTNGTVQRVGDGGLGRLTAGGTADAGFGRGDGNASVDAGARGEQFIGSALQPDGKVVVVGRRTFYDSAEAWSEDALIARVNPDGTPDTSFGTGAGGGFSSSDFGAYFHIFSQVAVQPDGKILAAGGHQPTLASSGAAAVVRYLADGSLDPTFGARGRIVIDFVAGTDEVPTDLMALPDGRVLICGHLNAGSDRNRFIARFGPAGELDLGFGGAGTGFVVLDATGSAGTNDNEAALGLAVDPAGQIYLGSTATAPTRVAMVSRFNPDGTLDTSYATAGTATVSMASGDKLAAVARDPNGKFVFAGDRLGTDGSRDFLALRLTAAGQPDASFGHQGVRAIDAGSTLEVLNEVHFLDGGAKVLLTGQRMVDGVTAWAAVQLEGDALPTTLPAWLAAGSAATWDAATKTLTLDGPATITADPGDDAPLIVGSTAAAHLAVAAAAGDRVDVGGLALSNGARLTLADAATDRVLVVGVGGLNVTGAAVLDLADNTLIVRGGNLATVSSAITAGFEGGNWLGSGITSSTSAADATRATALGYATAGQLGVTEFLGVTGLAPADVLVRHTSYGDTNLDRLVNTDDILNILAAGKLDTVASATWSDGDMNFDGRVDTDDILQILAAGRLDQ